MDGQTKFTSRTYALAVWNQTKSINDTQQKAKQQIVTKPRLRQSYVMTVIKHDPLGIDACTKDVNYQIFELYNVFGT